MSENIAKGNHGTDTVPDCILNEIKVEMTSNSTRISGTDPIGDAYLPQFSAEVSEISIVNNIESEWPHTIANVSIDLKLSNGATVALTLPHNIAHIVGDTVSRFEGVSE